MARTWQAAACAALMALNAQAAPSSEPVAPDELVQRASGREFSVNNQPRAGMDAALAPVAKGCTQLGGSLVPDREMPITFLPYRGATAPIKASLPTRMVCRAAGKDTWGLDIRIDNPHYVLPVAVGTSTAYFGKLVTSFVNGDQLEAEATLRATLRAIDQQAQEAHARACAAQRDAFVQRVRANPTIGTRVAQGMIIDIRGPIALIQYDDAARALNRREQAWVQISTLEPAEACPR